MAMARRLIREGRAQAFRELYDAEPPERTMPAGVSYWNARGGA